MLLSCSFKRGQNFSSLGVGGGGGATYTRNGCRENGKPVYGYSIHLEYEPITIAPLEGIHVGTFPSVLDQSPSLLLPLQVFFFSNCMPAHEFHKSKGRLWDYITGVSLPRPACDYSSH